MVSAPCNPWLCPWVAISKQHKIPILPVLIHGSCVYKVTGNAQLANTKPLLPGETSIRLLSASDHNVFASWSICNLVVCVLQFKDALCNIYCWLINRTQDHRHYGSCLNGACPTHVSSIRHMAAFSHLGARGSMAARCQRAIWNSEIPNKKH